MSELSNFEQFVTFQVDKLYLGIEVAKVQEVLQHQDTTRVPLADSEIKGIMNLRGQIITAIDLRRSLNIESEGQSVESTNVVVNFGNETYSLIVDKIGDVIELDNKSFQKTPSTLDKNLTPLLKGVYKLEKKLLLILNLENLFNSKI